MRYMCLIYDAESRRTSWTPEQQQAEMAAYYAFNQEFGDKIIGGEPLEPIATATTVRVRDGKAITTDGPFAETKEQLGGYYMIDAENLDEALAIAAKIPAANGGSIEVRPIMEIPKG